MVDSRYAIPEALTRRSTGLPRQVVKSVENLPILPEKSVKTYQQS
jgi:hypothetical protein